MELFSTEWSRSYIVLALVNIMNPKYFKTEVNRNSTVEKSQKNNHLKKKKRSSYHKPFFDTFKAKKMSNIYSTAFIISLSVVFLINIEEKWQETFKGRFLSEPR